ncbi:hypothetical protein C8Q80DRAFT_1267457 [Daedaleopsis nitida]|nr:hypothetical protein C8Q80DRAFT_1267457 [Daedaleopsis nitida]
MQLAKLLILVRWGNQTVIESLCQQYQYLGSFALYSKEDSTHDLHAPPRPHAPSVYKLYFNAEGQPHPFDKELEERLAPEPHGPFQLPGESRVAFLRRMKKCREDMITREGPPQQSDRLDCEAYVATGSLSKPYTHVYLWIEASVMYPDIPDSWRQLEYRAEVNVSAVPGLWYSHGADCRSYNTLYDEWDLWAEGATTSEELNPLTDFNHGNSVTAELGNGRGVDSNQGLAVNNTFDPTYLRALSNNVVSSATA